MKIEYYLPKTSFSGYISSIQGKILSDYVEVEIAKILSSYFKTENAFTYDSNDPSVSSGENWTKFTLKNHFFYITHYELKQRSDKWDTNLMRNWTLEASRGDEPYKLIDKRTIESSDSFFQKNASRLFKAKKGIFNSFKLRENSLLVVQSIEIYGVLCNTINDCNAFLSMRKSCPGKMRAFSLSYLLIIVLMS